MMAYDAADGYSVLFGGEEGYTYPFHAFNDTWIFHGGVWTETHPIPSPPPLSDGGFAMDPSTGCDVLFGGAIITDAQGDYLPVNQTWTYCHGAWQNDSPLFSPGPTWGSPLVSDPQCGCVVFFGGGSFTDWENQTWIYMDGLTPHQWFNVTPVHSPSARVYPSVAFDSETDSVVLFGGASPYCADDCGDTWELSFVGGNTAVWTQVFPTTTPHIESAATMTSDPGGGGVLMFGGLLEEGPANSPFALNYSWLFHNGNWFNVTPHGLTPAPRGDSAGAFEPPYNCTVLFGGGRNGGPTFGDTWTFGCQPATISESGLPSNRTWLIELNATTLNSTSDNQTFYLGHGSYSYSTEPALGLPDGEGYMVSPRAGTIEIAGTPATVVVRYQLQYRLVVRNDPSLYGYTSTDGGWFNASTSVSISATAATGYGFAMWNGSGNGSYTGSDVDANITVNSPVNETAEYAVAYSIEYLERGLPYGSAWELNIGGRSFTSNSSTLVVALINGTYSWRLASIKSDFEPVPASGTASVVGNGLTIDATFHELAGSSTNWWNQPIAGLSTDVWGGIALAAAAITAFLISVRFKPIRHAPVRRRPY
jgi:hypothetical protein